MSTLLHPTCFKMCIAVRSGEYQFAESTIMRQSLHHPLGGVNCAAMAQMAMAAIITAHPPRPVALHDLTAASMTAHSSRIDVSRRQYDDNLCQSCHQTRSKTPCRNGWIILN
jgi:hypothetical protein